MNTETVLSSLKSIFYRTPRFSIEELEQCRVDNAAVYSELKSGDASLSSKIDTIHADLIAFDIVYNRARKPRFARNGNRILPLNEIVDFRDRIKLLRSFISEMEESGLLTS